MFILIVFSGLTNADTANASTLTGTVSGAATTITPKATAADTGATGTVANS